MFASHNVTPKSVALIFDVIRKIASADHPLLYNHAARDNDGIWHNIQMQAQRQYDPKKNRWYNKG